MSGPINDRHPNYCIYLFLGGGSKSFNQHIIIDIVNTIFMSLGSCYNIHDFLVTDLDICTSARVGQWPRPFRGLPWQYIWDIWVVMSHYGDGQNVVATRA